MSLEKNARILIKVIKRNPFHVKVFELDSKIKGTDNSNNLLSRYEIFIAPLTIYIEDLATNYDRFIEVTVKSPTGTVVINSKGLNINSIGPLANLVKVAHKACLKNLYKQVNQILEHSSTYVVDVTGDTVTLVSNAGIDNSTVRLFISNAKAGVRKVRVILDSYARIEFVIEKPKLIKRLRSATLSGGKSELDVILRPFLKK